MKSRLARAAAVLMAAGGLAAVFSGCSAKKTEQEVIHLKMAVADADNSAQAEGAREIAREVEKATDGMIQIEVLAGGTCHAGRHRYCNLCKFCIYTMDSGNEHFRSALSLYQ